MSAVAIGDDGGRVVDKKWNLEPCLKSSVFSREWNVAEKSERLWEK